MQEFDPAPWGRGSVLEQGAQTGNKRQEKKRVKAVHLRVMKTAGVSSWREGHEIVLVLDYLLGGPNIQSHQRFSLSDEDCTPLKPVSLPITLTRAACRRVSSGLPEDASMS